MANPEVGSIKFEVDISEITRSLQYLDQIPRHVLSGIAKEVESAAREELLNIFGEAMDQQDEDDFPIEFQKHIFDVLEATRFDTAVAGNSFEISFDFNQLGTRHDLERAFHQGALLSDGSKLDGPYEGQQLKNSDADRHIFWEAIQQRQTHAPNPNGPGFIKIKPQAWEETKRKYIEIWGNKAPNWLYLQFGQDKWEPKIRSFPIIETFSTVLNETASQIFYNRVAEEIETANSFGATLTPFGARLTQATNEIGPSGKPRKPGQFYPLH